MKPFVTISLFFVILFAVSPSVNGQIKVFSNNNVGVGWTGTAPSSKLVLNSAGNSMYQAYFYNANISTGGAAVAM